MSVNELRAKFGAPPPVPTGRPRGRGSSANAGIGGTNRPPLPSKLPPPSRFSVSKEEERVTEDVTDDLYLEADVASKATSPAVSSTSPAPRLPPPRKGSASGSSPLHRTPSRTSAEARLNGSGCGSGDGVFFRGPVPSMLGTPSTPKEGSDVGLVFQYYANEDVTNPLFWEVRGASRMGFGTDLQDKTAHDIILKLNDQELKLMETLKRVVQHRIKADKEYATSLGLLNGLANRFEEDPQIQHKGFAVKAWNTIIKEADAVSKLLRQHADEMNTVIVDKLANMIKEKVDLKKQYMQERTKIDTDYMKVKVEVKDSLARYQRAAKEAKDAKAKYEEATLKGKPKDIDKAKDRYKKTVLKLHKCHNEYVLALKAATLHQEHYRTSILPRLLECLQQSQESQIAQVKQTMSDLANLTSTCTGDFVASQNAVMRSIAELRPDNEYSNFVENHKVDSPAREYFEFDPSVMDDFPDGLEANAIVVDNLTLESAQHTQTSLSDSLAEVRELLSSKKQELQSLDEEIRAIAPSPTAEDVLLDLLSKQKRYRDVSREIQDLKCQEAKLSAQKSMLDQKLPAEGEEDSLPPGIDLPDTPLPSVNTISKTSTLGTPSEKKTKISIGRMTNVFKRGGDSEKPPSEIPIEDEEWYHGALPRPETEELLVNDGDFLVREKSDASGQFVLSARTSGRIRHFPIQINEDNMYRLEGTAFPTVGHLIRHQLSTGSPVTKASGACLIHPVVKVRDEHDLRHEEIELKEKLGAGHFGDVFRGKLKKDGTPVAVKTCKETVDAATRRKFLMEANILKQYHHDNIVKLIGVCTDKHPIYIVMELVPGGDLLSFLRSDDNDISNRQMVKMAEDTGAGMAFLESKNCIHRDLAARNCLVGHKNIIKISDFGMSREDDVYTIKGGAMRQIPIKWTAPEAMNYGKYTTMSDVWSFGILLYEIFSHGSSPYPGLNNTEARDKVEQGYRMPAPQGTPQEIYVLMSRCWEYHDENRPKFKEIHSILKKLSHTVKQTSLSDSLAEVRELLSSKKQELQSLDEEIRAILLDLLSKQKRDRDVSREIQDLKCQEAKLSAQKSMLDQKLPAEGEEDSLPPGIDLPDTPLPSVNTISKTSTLGTPSEKKTKISIGRMTNVFKRGGDSEKPPSEIPIEDEEWYHGALPRPETEELLVNDGDFLVREKSDASGQFVLSARTSGRIRHFPIQINEDNMYCLEGTAFPTVGHLIRHQLSTGSPVTKASGACLIHPVVKVRDEHDLRHEEIELKEKLGAGHFGDVFRGKLKKDGTPVAVKTCKETVDAATRRKFLMEANILKQYHHDNIVKLIGVCTDKHPIYIVMELVPGGDLLSFLRSDDNDISNRQMVKMAEDTGAGMAFLESKNCIHRDLAARNCLVGHKNIIKISDFGMSREDDVYTIKGGAMRQIPIKWTAPEAMNYGKYTTMSDVWSFGILLYEIFSHGSSPYPGLNNTEARDKVKQGYRMPAPQGTPQEIYVLMSRCWEYHDENRPKFKEIHSILKKLSHTVKQTSLSDSLAEVRELLSSKKQELQSLDEEIRAILLDLLSKQKRDRDVSREIQDLKCQEAKLSAQKSMLDQKLPAEGEEDSLPPGIDLPDTPLPSVNTISKTSTLGTPSEKKTKISIGRMTNVFKRGGDSEKPPSEIPIEDEEWYHGALPRPETEELLVNDGDFLVREKSDASGQFVLSARTSGRIRHFPIQINEDNMYCLEGTAFPTVGHLIRHQLSTGSPVTKASGACLIHPVVKVRDEHDLRHEEIELKEKLGAGHFGDVFRGKLKKDGTPVAVKTCKETVDAATRRKFLMEANILKQYHHDNIVKLIGVCTDKHPIYIVMELVPGGDLLSFLRSDDNDISNRQMVKMAEDTGAGMAFLESKNCIHRDLAARNCLVGHKNIIKISDFGMSREDDVYTIKGGAMRQIPIKWTAPEAMNYGKYTTMSDVWSFGILLYEIFSHGSSPYPGLNNTEARDKVKQGYRMPAPQGTPQEIYVLMSRCWEYHDENRPKFKEIHSILKKLSHTVK